MTNKLTAAHIVRLHFGKHTHDYAVSKIKFIAETYGLALADRVMFLIHRLNAMKGLTPRYFPTYTSWVREPVRGGR